MLADSERYSLFIINFYSLPECASYKTVISKVRDKGSWVNHVIPLINGLFSKKWLS